MGKLPPLARVPRRGSRAAVLVIALACLVVGGILFAIGGHHVLDEWRYRRQGVRSEAVVIGKGLRFATETSATRYEVSYAAVVEGRRYERTNSAPVHLWERVESGSALTVEHLRGRPDTLRIVTGGGASSRSLILTAVGAGLLVLGLLAAVQAVRRRPAPAHEPERPVPAPVAASDAASYWPLARQSPLVWTGAIILAVGTPFAAAGGWEVYREWRFAAHAQAADGMVLTKEITLSRRSSSRNTYEATYRFVVGGDTFEGWTQLSRADWMALTERQPVRVRYLPDAPSTSRLEGSSRWDGAAVLSVIGGLFTAIGGALFVRSVRRARMEWRLGHHGAVARGIVTDVRDRHLAINGVSQWRLHYEYDDFGGRRHRGTHDLSVDEAQLWKVGDLGAVRYDTGRPADALWLGRLEDERGG